jgi:hypothetical protein
VYALSTAVALFERRTRVVEASCLAAGAGFAQVPVLRQLAGALQRLAMLSGFAWLEVLAVRTLRGVDDRAVAG